MLACTCLKMQGSSRPSFSIRLSHWCRQVTEVTKFWTSCKRLKLLRKAGCLQVIQNSAPSVTWRCQCDIWITKKLEFFLNWCSLLWALYTNPLILNVVFSNIHIYSKIYSVLEKKQRTTVWSMSDIWVLSAIVLIT